MRVKGICVVCVEMLFSSHSPHHSYNMYTVYSIVNEEPNAEEMKANVKAYEEANKSQIVIRQSQRADEERSIADRYVLLQLLYRGLMYPSSVFISHYTTHIQSTVVLLQNNERRNDASVNSKKKKRPLPLPSANSSRNREKSCWANVKKFLRNSVLLKCKATPMN